MMKIPLNVPFKWGPNLSKKVFMINKWYIKLTNHNNTFIVNSFIVTFYKKNKVFDKGFSYTLTEMHRHFTLSF